MLNIRERTKLTVVYMNFSFKEGSINYLLKTFVLWILLQQTLYPKQSTLVIRKQNLNIQQEKATFLLYLHCIQRCYIRQTLSSYSSDLERIFFPVNLIQSSYCKIYKATGRLVQKMAVMPVFFQSCVNYLQYNILKKQLCTTEHFSVQNKELSPLKNEIFETHSNV